MCPCCRDQSLGEHFSSACPRRAAQTLYASSSLTTCEGAPAHPFICCLPRSSMPVQTEELTTSFHRLCWPVATWCASLYVPCQVPQLLPALRLHGALPAPGLCLRPVCAKWAENVQAIKPDHFRAIRRLISYVCQEDT